ncbi:hypothetical protein BD310DRAFT_834161 [Dichomitus squalens]|uniref:Uncharacterized protein n=1 Tax=Dichomitus squalens TaxID=114155 RepID=A0A4Q9PEM9_9APHY|nr:hypothetical protein BD310DRAFT_834161 [Dichomitus squalens]
MASAGEQIRIAIALAALRHKPPLQSVHAYILDLHAAFPPPPSTASGERESHRAPSPNPWRDRVLVLESDLRELQAQHDKDSIRTSPPALFRQQRIRVMSITKPRSGGLNPSTPLRAFLCVSPIPAMRIFPDCLLGDVLPRCQTGFSPCTAVH